MHYPQYQRHKINVGLVFACICVLNSIALSAMEQNNLYHELPKFYLRNVINDSGKDLTITDMFSQSSYVIPPGKAEFNKKLSLVKQNNIWKNKSKIVVNGQELYLIIHHMGHKGFYNTKVQLGRKNIMGSVRKLCGYKSKNYTYFYPAYNIDVIISEDIEDSKIVIFGQPESNQANQKNIMLEE